MHARVYSWTEAGYDRLHKLLQHIFHRTSNLICVVYFNSGVGGQITKHNKFKCGTERQQLYRNW